MYPAPFLGPFFTLFEATGKNHFLTPREKEPTSGFGDRIGQKAWQEGPGEHRSEDEGAGHVRLDALEVRSLAPVTTPPGRSQMDPGGSPRHRRTRRPMDSMMSS